MPAWDDEPLGTFGRGAQVPTGQWFGVDTTTGGWQLPGVQPETIAANVSSVPSLGLTDPGRQPLDPSLGAFGTKPLGPQPAMQRLSRLDQMGALTPARSPWQDVLTAVGGAAGGGPGVAQAFGRQEQQQQQQLQNRLTMRRQALQEEQNERAEIRDDFNSLLKLSEIKSKSLRKLYTDRFVADMQSRGKTLPPDFVEAFKNSGQEEAKAMLQFYEPLLTELGLDPTAFADLVSEGGIKDVAGALELAQKLKKQRADEAEGVAIAQQRGQLFGTGTVGDASGTAPAAPGASGVPPPTAPTTPRQPHAAPPQEYTTAIDEASKSYPTVRKALIPAIIAGESNFDAKAVSPKGAQGPMQLMPAAQKEMGVTDPFDVTQNVRGGTGYYAKMLERYKGNEAMALAAYSWGPGNVDRVQGDLSQMPAETQAYVKTTLQRASAGGGTAPATRMQVAWPGAPAPQAASPQDQVQLTRLEKQIDGMTQYINANLGSGKERTKGFVNEIQQERTRLISEREKLAKKLGEPAELETRLKTEQPFKLEQAREAKALTPIDRMTQQSLATNKSVYRSIGKIEQYFREGTDLPENFVNLVAQDAPGIRAAMQADPKNATGILQQWETKLQGVSKNDPNVNRFLSALGNMRDLIIRERSGGSVTGNELDRAMGAFMGSLPNVNQAFSLFVQNLANVKEMVMDELVTAGAAARPLSGGKAMYGTLPKEVRERIDYAERGEEYPKAKVPEKRPQVTGPITQVSP